MYESPVQTALEQYGRRLERLIPAGFVEELAYFPKLEIIDPLPLVNPKTGEVQEFTHCQPAVVAFAGDVHEISSRQTIETAPRLEIALLEGETAHRGLLACLQYERLNVRTQSLRRGRIPNVDGLLRVSNFQLAEGEVLGDRSTYGSIAKPGSPRDSGPPAEATAIVVTELARLIGGRKKRDMLDLASYEHRPHQP